MGDFLKQYGYKVAIALIWLSVAAGVWLFARQTGLSALEMVQAIIDFASTSLWGPIVYVVAYAIRPLTLLPSVLLSVAAGIIFGPLWGLVLAVLGSNASANLDYAVGYFMGRGFLNLEQMNQTFSRYVTRLRDNSFETVLTMRLIFLPYDAVGLFAGFMRIRWVEFALATLLGGFAGTLSFVLFGASIEGEFVGQTPEIRPWSLILAGVLFVSSIALSRLIKRREPTPSIE